MYYEDAIEDGRLVMGQDGKPLRTHTTSSGVEYFETGDPEIDRLEREFAEACEAEAATAGVLSDIPDDGEVDLLDSTTK